MYTRIIIVPPRVDVTDLFERMDDEDGKVSTTGLTWLRGPEHPAGVMGNAFWTMGSS